MQIAPHHPPPPPSLAALSSRMATLMGAKCLHHCTTLAPPDLIKQIASHHYPHCSLQSDGYIDGRRVLSPVCATLAVPDQIMQMTPHTLPHCCSQ